MALLFAFNEEEEENLFCLVETRGKRLVHGLMSRVIRDDAAAARPQKKKKKEEEDPSTEQKKKNHLRGKKKRRQRRWIRAPRGRDLHAAPLIFNIFFLYSLLS